MFLINESHLRSVAKKFCITRCFMQIFSLSAEIWGNSFSAQKISSLLPFDNNLLEFPMKFDIFHWVSEQYEHWKKLRQGLLKCFCMFLCNKSNRESFGAPLRVIWQVNCLWIVTSHLSNCQLFFQLLNLKQHSKSRIPLSVAVMCL